MESTVFAFRVAKPVELIAGEPPEHPYDPQAQRTIWSGDGKPDARYTCTNASYGYHNCNAYGNYCNTSSPRPYGQYCDWI